MHTHFKLYKGFNILQKLGGLFDPLAPPLSVPLEYVTGFSRQIYSPVLLIIVKTVLVCTCLFITYVLFSLLPWLGRSFLTVLRWQYGLARPLSEQVHHSSRSVCREAPARQVGGWLRVRTTGIRWHYSYRTAGACCKPTFYPFTSLAISPQMSTWVGAQAWPLTSAWVVNTIIPFQAIDKLPTVP